MCTREKERASAHPASSSPHPPARTHTVGHSRAKRLLSAEIMDGTKPVMESSAEEAQDEGQESKGTRPLTRGHLRLSARFAPNPRGSARLCARRLFSPSVSLSFLFHLFSDSQLCVTQVSFPRFGSAFPRMGVRKQMQGRRRWGVDGRVRERSVHS